MPMIVVMTERYILKYPSKFVLTPGVFTLLMALFYIYSVNFIRWQVQQVSYLFIWFYYFGRNYSFYGYIDKDSS